MPPVTRAFREFRRQKLAGGGGGTDKSLVLDAWTTERTIASPCRKKKRKECMFLDTTLNSCYLFCLGDCFCSTQGLWYGSLLLLWLWLRSELRAHLMVKVSKWEKWCVIRACDVMSVMCHIIYCYLYLIMHVSLLVTLCWLLNRTRHAQFDVFSTAYYPAAGYAGMILR